MDDEPGGPRQAHTVRLELTDEPGELLRALEPIADRGGNLLSIFHERGSLTPRGRIPVEIDLEATAHQFETIIDALRDQGVNVIQAGTERYAEEVTLLLVGHLIDTDLSDTIERIEENAHVSVIDLSLSGEVGTDHVSTARIRLATEAGRIEDAIGNVRGVAAAKDLRVIEPLVGEA
ncbi:ACT-domain-containing protein, predicted allosteric regulator of homoserine dehydrogenase [Halanaeroarchaeum sp. HSR-CO]|uniref:amino acid-binding protein n=1 Tax=Halanaeroarchaeum sp. HSR-CO TaxID=2866382 RepID=UPI00217F106F|nr:amino acid-binding protein [Halanaeroarchaeum sp. HSR-CO]UWG46850.1 ACT-domain-containing protein, predicted allosteric regulator of homoserine dehydrogenase [Halanaeroarchaeum sp. HSR-CO]